LNHAKEFSSRLEPKGHFDKLKLDCVKANAQVRKTMTNIQTIASQNRIVRQKAEMILRSISEQSADKIPANWNNNARWHAGHLVVTPRLITYGLLGKPLGVPEEYRKWFGKGSSPSSWQNENPPSFEELISQIVSSTDSLYEELSDLLEVPYAKPYTTSLGAVLHYPGESLMFSMVHDGIHVGLLLALKRDIQDS
jgi:hypothetical protein